MSLNKIYLESPHYPGISLLTFDYSLNVTRLLTNQALFCCFAEEQKEKRLKKDAGRQRWSPYFSRGKRGGGSDDNDPLDDMSKDSIDGYGSKSDVNISIQLKLFPPFSLLFIPFIPYRNTHTHTHTHTHTNIELIYINKYVIGCRKINKYSEKKSNKT